MNEEVWHKIFKKYIADFDAIDKLQAYKIIDKEETASLKNNLLVDIIITMKSEVSENADEHQMHYRQVATQRTDKP